jgi:hypothetical protein
VFPGGTWISAGTSGGVTLSPRARCGMEIAKALIATKVHMIESRLRKWVLISTSTFEIT